jgi:hypothetical protein
VPRAFVHITRGADRRALAALGGRREYRWWGRWVFPIADEAALARLLGSLRDLGLPFLGAGPGWHPGAVFEDLRDRGLVAGSYRKIYWTGPGEWHVRDA